jgi:hypothetical protein
MLTALKEDDGLQRAILKKLREQDMLGKIAPTAAETAAARANEAGEGGGRVRRSR